MNKLVYLYLSILDLSKTLMHEFWQIIQNQNMVKMQRFVIWVQIASLFMQKQMTFIKTFQNMLKQDLTLQILKQTDHYLKKKIKKK